MTPARPAIGPEQRHARLAVRHHLHPAHRALTVEEAAGDLVGLHATDPTTVHLSAWARVDGLDRATTEHALYEDRTLVRMIGMRRTLFVETLELATIVHAACAPSIVPRERRRIGTWLLEAGITDDPARWLASVEDHTAEAIRRLGAATAVELAKVVPELAIRMPISVGKSYQGTVGVSTRVLFLLAMDGRVARGRPKGTWISSQYRWEPMDRWVAMDGPATERSEAAAQAALVERWLAAFGPGTEEDLRWWSGWTVKAVRQALSTVATVEVDLGGGTIGLVLADDLENDPRPPAAPWVALLPSLDATIMGWAARDWYLGSYRSTLFDRNGNAGPTIWVDGRVVGGWGQRPNGDVTTRVLEDVGAEAMAAIAERAGALSTWLGGVRIMPRFPTPIQLDLSG